MIRLLREAGRGRMERSKAEQLKTAACEWLAMTKNTHALALEIRFLVERLTLLIEKIAQLLGVLYPPIPSEEKPLFTNSQ